MNTETEGFILAIQDHLVVTRNYEKYVNYSSKRTHVALQSVKRDNKTFYRCM